MLAWKAQPKARSYAVSSQIHAGFIVGNEPRLLVLGRFQRHFRNRRRTVCYIVHTTPYTALIWPWHRSTFSGKLLSMCTLQSGISSCIAYFRAFARPTATGIDAKIGFDVFARAG